MAQPQFQVDRTTALYERPAMDIVDATTFAEVKQAIASAFAPGNVEKFLKSVERESVRIRSFESVLQAGLLGKETTAQYAEAVEWRPGADSGVLPGVGGAGGSKAS